MMNLSAPPVSPYGVQFLGVTNVYVGKEWRPCRYCSNECRVTSRATRNTQRPVCDRPPPSTFLNRGPCPACAARRLAQSIVCSKRLAPLLQQHCPSGNRSRFDGYGQCAFLE